MARGDRVIVDRSEAAQHRLGLGLSAKSFEIVREQARIQVERRTSGTVV